MWIIVLKNVRPIVGCQGCWARNLHLLTCKRDPLVEGIPCYYNPPGHHVSLGVLSSGQIRPSAVDMRAVSPMFRLEVQHD